MKVQMKYRLPRVRANVRHDAIATAQAMLSRELTRDAQALARGNYAFLIPDLIQRFDMSVGDDQNVCWSAGMRVVEGSYRFIPIDYLGGSTLGNDFAKDTEHRE